MIIATVSGLTKKSVFVKFIFLNMTKMLKFALLDGYGIKFIIKSIKKNIEYILKFINFKTQKIILEAI